MQYNSRIWLGAKFDRLKDNLPFGQPANNAPVNTGLLALKSRSVVMFQMAYCIIKLSKAALI